MVVDNFVFKMRKQNLQ